MAREWKRVSARLGLFLTLAVLAGCGIGTDTPSPDESGEELGTSTPGKSSRDTRWVHPVRSAGESDAPVAVAQDAQDNVLTLSNHRTSIDFGQGPLGSPPGASVLAVSKHAPDGQLLWVRLLAVPASPGSSPPRQAPIEATAYVRGQALAVDKRGDVLLTGVHSGGLELGAGPLPPGAFLARLDANGHPRWARHLPTSATELAVDNQGDITLAGTLTGKADFGNGPVTGTSHPYLVRYDAAGLRPRWVRVDSERGVVMDLAQDDAGDLYLAGGRFPAKSSLLMPFLARVSAEGEVQWKRTLDGASGLGMSVAAHGDHVVVSGSFTGQFVFRGQTLRAQGSRGFALTYGRGGDERWSLLLGSTWGLVAMDQGSGVVVAGRYTGGEDFGLGQGPLDGYPGATNLYVLRLQRPTGELRWLRTFPSASSLPVDLSAARQGESALVGTFRASVDFGTGPLTPLPGANTFVLQLER